MWQKLRAMVPSLDLFLRSSHTLLSKGETADHFALTCHYERTNTRCGEIDKEKWLGLRSDSFPGFHSVIHSATGWIFHWKMDSQHKGSPSATAGPKQEEASFSSRSPGNRGTNGRTVEEPGKLSVNGAPVMCHIVSFPLLYRWEPNLNDLKREFN